MGVKARNKGRKAIEKKAQALESLSIEYVAIDSIRANTYNPNRQSDHDFELLVRSMREDGFTQPIIVQRATREIVDGEHRWRAAAELKHDTIPVVLVDMSPEQMRIATLRHNRARGSEDMDLSGALLRDLRELGALDWAQDSLMIDDVELQRMLEDLPAPEALAGEEYSSAWEPGEEGAVEVSDRDGSTVGMTMAAVERIREQERRIREAKTEQERKAARADADIYRISLVFAGDEAKVVRKALGGKPAERLLQICREQHG